MSCRRREAGRRGECRSARSASLGVEESLRKLASGRFGASAGRAQGSHALGARQFKRPRATWFTLRSARCFTRRAAEGRRGAENGSRGRAPQVGAPHLSIHNPKVLFMAAARGTLRRGQFSAPSAPPRELAVHKSDSSSRGDAENAEVGARISPPDPRRVQGVRPLDSLLPTARFKESDPLIPLDPLIALIDPESSSLRLRVSSPARSSPLAPLA